MEIKFKPKFPTSLHRYSAELIKEHFLKNPSVDTVLIVNSCARGQAVPESDLDFAILVKPGTDRNDIKSIEHSWEIFSEKQSTLLEFKQSSQFAHLHLDIIDGNYVPTLPEIGGPIDYFEIEIGNQICYSAPMNDPGSYFKELQNKWLPYYDEELRLQRLQVIKETCNYDLDHVPFLIKRQLYFHAFDILCKAFQKYLQTLFITNSVYPIAYNKWIKEQVAEWLKRADLYPKLSLILSITDIESKQINDKANNLRELLNDLG